MEGCCILVIVIVLVVILIAWGTAMWYGLLLIVNVGSVWTMWGINSIKRAFWKRKITRLDFRESKTALLEQQEHLSELKNIATALMSERKPAGEPQSHILEIRIDINQTKITDAEAKIAIIQEINKKSDLRERAT